MGQEWLVGVKTQGVDADTGSRKSICVCRIYNNAVKPDCDPPFNATPDCYTGFGEFMITSPECALSYSRLFNITDATPLVAVAAAVNEIQSMCDAITTEVLASSAVLHALDRTARQGTYCHDIFHIRPIHPTKNRMPVCTCLFQQIFHAMESLFHSFVTCCNSCVPLDLPFTLPATGVLTAASTSRVWPILSCAPFQTVFWHSLQI